MAEPSSSYKPRGAAGTLDNKYQMGSMMYPADLMSEQYGGNYAIFYVNVHEDSKLYRGNEGAFVDGTSAPSQRGSASGLSAGGVTAAAAVTGAAAAQGAGVAQKATGGSLSRGASVAANLAGGALVGAAAVAAVGGAKKEYKRSQMAIALHMPTDLSIKYGMGWEETDLAGATAIAMGLENAGKLKLGAAAGVTKDYLAGKALGVPGTGALLSKSSGVAANPKKEQIFKRVNYREFTFSYQFFPRNAKEAENVRAIIKQFKLHMHPEFKNAAEFLYIYPSEFDIYYYQNGKENLNIHRHTSCVLTDLNITYAPQGTFSSFSDGMPTQINIQLSFRELALLTKDFIQDGY